MKNNMEDIDQLIKETLSQEEAKFYDDLEEQSMLGMILGLFKGKNAWFLVVLNIVTVVFFGLFIYCLVQFFNVEEIKELLKWGFGSIIFIIGVSMLKVFAWLQMDKNALLRELTRLELQVSSLSGKI